MPLSRRCLPFVIAVAAALWIPQALALSLSPTATPAVLGQPLDFAVQVQLQPGETLAPECVSAEVSVGDRRVPPALVRALLDSSGSGSARIRVVTEPAIDEPVVGVVLSAGCAPARVTRRYVVLADPPLDRLAPVVPTQALAPIAAPPSDSGVQPPLPMPPEAAASVPGPASETRPAATPSPRAEARPERRRAKRVATAPAQRRPSPPTAAPRLRLEPLEPTPAPMAAGIEQAMQAVAEAALAARAAASAASAASARIATLGRTVADLRAEASAERAQAAALGARLARAEQASRWTTPLLALVLLLTAVAAWLVWRLNAADRARQRGWQVPQPVAQGAQTSVLPALGERPSELTPSRLPTAPIPFVNSEVALPQAPAPAARARPAWPAPAVVAPPAEPSRATRSASATQALSRPEADSAMARTDVLPPRGVLEDSAPRDVSIEELIDLEQQAEFFIVLGQDEAAIDLMMDHLRQTGGGSPLPYLKLLEIYGRRGERAEYERMRHRFNQRFNAYAPEWGADLQAGRGLETYTGVIPRLQQVWPRPLDAMAELEALLFRKSRGELFELPAYREVLFLYSMARDLLDREAGDSGHIDLLLPMADGTEFSSTSPSPYLAMERNSVRGVLDSRTTEPLDFDISGPSPTNADGPATSIFGPLDGPTATRSRR